MCFDYSKLRGRIVEKLGSQRKLADRLGISKTVFSQKMTGNIRFTTDDITKISSILDIPSAEIGVYFFTPKVK